jgi:hypothetical protein
MTVVMKIEYIVAPTNKNLQFVLQKWVMQGLRDVASENILDEHTMPFCPLVLYVFLVLGLLIIVVPSEKFIIRKF